MMVKRMDLKRYRVPFTVLALSIFVLAAIFAYTLPKEKAPEKTVGLTFPTGISSALGTVSSVGVGEEQFNTISVTGSGSVSMQADEAVVTLGVQTQDESASEAVRLNAERMTAIIDEIEALGIPAERLRTVSYDVYPVYAKEDYTVVVGYRVVNMIEVKITKMELIGEAIDAAAENGANIIQGVSFGISEEKQAELKKQAYLAALNDAEEKANLIVEELKLTIKGVLSVSENYYQPYQPYRDYKLAVAGEAVAPTPILEGKLSVSVTVHIVYTFE